MRSCTHVCWDAAKVPAAKCRCICGGGNHGTVAHLPGFKPEDDEQGGKDPANEDARDVRSNQRRNPVTPTPAADEPAAQVYRGVRYLAFDEAARQKYVRGF